MSLKEEQANLGGEGILDLVRLSHMGLLPIQSINRSIAHKLGVQVWRVQLGIGRELVKVVGRVDQVLYMYNSILLYNSLIKTYRFRDLFSMLLFNSFLMYSVS